MRLRSRVATSAVIFALGAALAFLDLNAAGSPPKVGISPGSAVTDAPLALLLDHNLRILILASTGILTFGFSTAVVLLVVGIWTIAPVAAAWQSGTSPIILFAAIAPHGILEVPAIVMSGAAGLVGITPLVSICRSRPLRARNICRDFATNLLAALVLGCAASVVESRVTGWILNHVLRSTLP
jgi:stage II sporulation protein M